MSLDDYKSQLADIELLLADAPEDESLLKLKSDLVELIELTEEQEGGEGNDNIEGDNAGGSQIEDSHGENQQTNASAAHDVEEEKKVPLSAGSQNETSVDAQDESNSASITAKPKMSLKKSKKILSKPFEIPTHLIPLDSDTDAEKKRKKRAVKALKAQYKATQKSVESEVKQQSWQNFNNKKKKKRKGGESIFKTEDGIGARVGVITGSVQVTGKERAGNAKPSSASSKKQRHLF